MRSAIERALATSIADEQRRWSCGTSRRSPERVETIAVCLLHSFVNPVHELAIRDLIRERAPEMPVSISYEVLPEIKEYERTSTTVVNAYVMPVVATYLRALRMGLDDAGIAAMSIRGTITS